MAWLIMRHVLVDPDMEGLGQFVNPQAGLQPAPGSIGHDQQDVDVACGQTANVLHTGLVVHDQVGIIVGELLHEPGQQRIGGAVTSGAPPAAP